MDFRDFRKLFGPSIRAWLNWKELTELEVNVRESVITERSQLGELLTVWYVNPDGTKGDWRDANSQPQKISEAAVNQGAWTESKSSNIERFRSSYVEFQEPVTLVLPAYRIGEELLLLDSTHRAVAAFLADVEIRLLIISIEGPVKESILPDLGRFSALIASS